MTVESTSAAGRRQMLLREGSQRSLKQRRTPELKRTQSLPLTIPQRNGKMPAKRPTAIAVYVARGLSCAAIAFIVWITALTLPVSFPGIFAVAKPRVAPPTTGYTKPSALYSFFFPPGERSPSQPRSNPFAGKREVLKGQELRNRNWFGYQWCRPTRDDGRCGPRFGGAACKTPMAPYCIASTGVCVEEEPLFEYEDDEELEAFAEAFEKHAACVREFGESACNFDSPYLEPLGAYDYTCAPVADPLPPTELEKLADLFRRDPKNPRFEGREKARFEEWQAARAAEAYSEPFFRKPVRILLVSVVFDHAGSLDRMERVRDILHEQRAPLCPPDRPYTGAPGETFCMEEQDTFHFAIFHADQKNELWSSTSRDDWYNNNDEVVIRYKDFEHGCKTDFWMAGLTNELVEDYDYLWLRDEDIGLRFFNWQIYRSVLLGLRPLVTQPAIVPGWNTRKEDREVKNRWGFAPYHRTTFYGHLRLKGDEHDDDWHEPWLNWRGGYLAGTLAREVAGPVEVMSPIISAAIWPAMRERMARHDPRSDWGIDDFWTWVAMLAKRECSAGGEAPVASLVIDGSPVMHLNTGSLNSNHRCKRSCIIDKNDLLAAMTLEDGSINLEKNRFSGITANCFGFTEEDMANVSQDIAHQYPQCKVATRTDKLSGPMCNGDDLILPAMFDRGLSRFMQKFKCRNMLLEGTDSLRMWDMGGIIADAKYQTEGGFYPRLVDRVWSPYWVD